MSEYQYYEFQTIGRTLDKVSLQKLEELSSRAIVTSSKAIYTYSYSDFRGDPKEILADYFDIMLYLTNFGERQLMFRLPLNLIDPSKLDIYCREDVISYSIHGDFLVLDLSIYDEEGGGWVEGEGLLDNLIMIRNDLLLGDFRALYMVWLAAIQFYLIGEDEFEPPIPDNLKKLPNRLNCLIDYFKLNNFLVKAAAELSTEVTKSAEVLEKLITNLADQEKNQFLLGLLNDEPDLKIKFEKKLEDCISKNGKKNQFNPRSAGELKDSAEKIYDQENKKIKMEKEEIRNKQLQLLVGQEGKIWGEINNFMSLKTAKGYDMAVKLLHDLKDLSTYLNKSNLFKIEIDKIKQDYSRLSLFKRKLSEKGL